MRFSITLKFLSGVFLVVAIVLSGFTYVTVKHEEKLLYDDIIEHSKTINYLITNQLFDEIVRTSTLSPEERIGNMVKTIPHLVKIELIAENGKNIFSLNLQNTNSTTLLADSTLKRYLEFKNWVNQSTEVFQFETESEIKITSPVVIRGMQLSLQTPYAFNGICILTYSTKNIQNIVQSTAQQILLISGLMFLVALVLAFFASRFLVKTIYDLIAVSKKFQAGNYSARMENLSNDEIGELSLSFNEMATEIEISIANLTEQKQSLEYITNQAIKSESRLRSLLENARDAIIHLDSDGKLIYANLRFQQMMGFVNISDKYNFFDSVEKDYVENVKYYLKNIENEYVGNDPIHFILNTVGNKKSDIEMTANVLMEENSHIIQAVLRDVTERSLLQEQLVQARKLESIGRLAGGIAHDFNNLLAIIIPNAELIHFKGGDEKIVHNAEQIISAAKRASEVVKQLLNFSRQRINNIKPGNLNKLIKDTADLLEKLVTHKVKIILNLTAVYDLVEMDETQIQQVLINLAVNARDAMTDGGTLTFSTALAKSTIESAKPDLIELAVSDTGTGIPEEHLTKIFEPFFTTKKIGEGTGLGLAGVYGIVQQHNGKISVKSVVNRGTIFTISLPLYYTGRK